MTEGDPHERSGLQTAGRAARQADHAPPLRRRHGRGGSVSADRPSGRGEHRPDQTAKPEHRPFPGQPDNRPYVLPPTGTKTADEMRAERAKYKTNSEYQAAKAAEKAAARQAATENTTPAKQATAPKEAPTAWPGASTTAERTARPRDQDPADTSQRRGSADTASADETRPGSTLFTPQYASPDADAATGAQAETPSKAVPDQSPDSQSLTAVEHRMMAALNSMKADYDEKFNAQQAQYDARLEMAKEELRTEYETRLAGYQTQLEELKARLAQREQHAVPEDAEQAESSGTAGIIRHGERSDVRSAGDTDGEADGSDIINRANDESDIAEDKTLSAPDRSDLRKAGTAGVGAAGQFGMVNPVLQLTLGGNDALHTFKEMSPNDQYDTVNVLDSFVNASSSMSPGTAFFATMTAAYGPSMYARGREIAEDAWRKIRRND